MLKQIFFPLCCAAPFLSSPWSTILQHMTHKDRSFEVVNLDAIYFLYQFRVPWFSIFQARNFFSAIVMMEKWQKVYFISSIQQFDRHETKLNHHLRFFRPLSRDVIFSSFQPTVRSRFEIMKVRPKKNFHQKKIGTRAQFHEAKLSVCVYSIELL